jgi:ATP-dependent RNA helicase DeaD
MPQTARNRVMKGFRDGTIPVLVATDVVGRGIDVNDISHVINFDIPENVDDYVHRGGRTARGAALGIESTIGTWQDIPMVRQIETVLGEKIPRCTVPGIEPWTESEKTPAKRRMRV